MAASVSPIRRRGAVGTAAASGSRRSLLEALRDNISADLDKGVPPRDKASLSKRLLDISAELEALDDGHDDLSQAASTPDEAWIAE
jgi:hypothetical protein